MVVMFALLLEASVHLLIEPMQRNQVFRHGFGASDTLKITVRLHSLFKYKNIGLIMPSLSTIKETGEFHLLSSRGILTFQMV